MPGNSVRRFGFFIAGLLNTIALSLLLINFSSNLPPTYFESGKQEAYRKSLCLPPFPSIVITVMSYILNGCWLWNRYPIDPVQLFSTNLLISSRVVNFITICLMYVAYF